MATFFDTFSNWSGGVVTSGRADQLGENASPRGRNSYLEGSAPDNIYPAKRRGFTTVNASNAQSTTSPITTQYQFIKIVAGTATRYHMLYSAADSGGIRVIASDPGGAGTTGSVVMTLGTAGIPDFATAVNHVFAVANGTNKKWDGTTETNFGITAPSTGATVAAGAGGTPTGTYEVRYTFYNGTTGHESSASATSGTVTLTADVLAVSSVDVSGDSQVTARRVYVRNTATMTNFYLAGTIADNSTTTFNWDAADSTLITVGPDTEENNPPPTSSVIAWHRSRMFTSDGVTLFYSKSGKPEAFDPDFFEYVNPQDGQVIMALVSYGDVLLIFKQRAVYGLFGIDPATWQVRLLWDGVGLTRRQALTVFENTIWWTSENGPMQSRNLETPIPIGRQFLRPSMANTNVDFISNTTCVAVMPEQELVLFSGARTNYFLTFAWNYRLQRWVTDEWNYIPIRSLLSAKDDTGKWWTYIGNENGQVFRWWDADNDGVVGGTVTGTFVAAGSSQSTVTSTGFYTTGQGNTYRSVNIIDSNGALVATRLITSNTSTVLTLASSFTTTASATYTFHVGGPAFEWDTKDEDSKAAFHRKRYEFLHLQTGDTAATVGVQIFTDFNETPTRYASYSTSSTTQNTVTNRVRVAAVGKAWRARITNYTHNAPLSLYEIGMTGAYQLPQVMA